MRRCGVCQKLVWTKDRVRAEWGKGGVVRQVVRCGACWQCDVHSPTVGRVGVSPLDAKSGGLFNLLFVTLHREGGRRGGLDCRAFESRQWLT